LCHRLHAKHVPESEENKESNQNAYTAQGTTQTYRHGRCHLCDKPVITDNLNPAVAFTCHECTQMKEEQDDPDDQQHQQHVLLNTITIILNKGYG
jgi:hypothetical protein